MRLLGPSHLGDAQAIWVNSGGVTREWMKQF